MRERTLYPLRAVCAPGGIKAINPSRSARAAELQVRRTGGGSYELGLVLAPGTTFVGVPGAGRVLYATLTDDRLVRLADDRPGSAARIVVGLTGPGCPG